MKCKTTAIAMVLSLFLLNLSISTADPKNVKTDDKKSKKGDLEAKINFRIKIAIEGKKVLPSQSKIELNSDDENCVNVLQAANISSESSEAIFTNIRQCTVKLKIYITGFDTKSISVDLANYKEPMRILVKAKGPPEIDDAGDGS